MSESEEKLFGVTPEMEKGFQKLKEIFDKEVFELYIRQGQGYVPYMMNDALECYLVLTDCRCTGEYLTGYEESTLGYLSSAEGERILVVHQGEENIFTLWFREIRIKLEGYQYHRIGHFWLEGKGQEQCSHPGLSADVSDHQDIHTPHLLCVLHDAGLTNDRDLDLARISQLSLYALRNALGDLLGVLI